MEISDQRLEIRYSPEVGKSGSLEEAATDLSVAKGFLPGRTIPKYPYRFNISRLIVRRMKVGFDNAPAFPGTGVHKTEGFARGGGYDAHVAHYAVGAVGAGKQDEVAQFSFPQWDGVLNGREINRCTGDHNAKVIKYIGHKA